MDETLRKLARDIRARGGDVEPVELSRRWLQFLTSEVQRNGLMDDELAHLCSLYEQLVSRSYLDGAPHKGTDRVFVDELVTWVNALDTTRMEGAVAAIFVCHQLAEVWLADLLSLQRFAIDLRLGSYRIAHPSLESQSVTGLCQQIEMSLDIPSRDDVLQSARALNSSRNRVAHKLLQSTSLDDIRRECDSFLAAFARFREAFSQAIEEASDTIKDFGKWSDMFENEFEDALRFRLDEAGVQYVDRSTFARREGLVIE